MANPNPSPETRFGAEKGPEPARGKTSAQKAAEYAAAEDAAIIRAQMLSGIREKIKSGADPLEFIDANNLKLFKDSEDRAHGTPKASSEISGPDGAAIPVTSVAYEIIDPQKDEN